MRELQRISNRLTTIENRDNIGGEVNRLLRFYNLRENGNIAERKSRLFARVGVRLDI
jgi:hypothetical protein